MRDSLGDLSRLGAAITSTVGGDASKVVCVVRLRGMSENLCCFLFDSKFGGPPATNDIGSEDARLWGGERPFPALFKCGVCVSSSSEYSNSVDCLGGKEVFGWEMLNSRRPVLLLSLSEDADMEISDSHGLSSSIITSGDGFEANLEVGFSYDWGRDGPRSTCDDDFHIAGSRSPNCMPSGESLGAGWVIITLGIEPSMFESCLDAWENVVAESLRDLGEWKKPHFFRESGDLRTSSLCGGNSCFGGLCLDRGLGVV